MWEKCVGCGEGLFAGDAFCGNCGRPATPSVPAAREPDGLEPARHAAPPAGWLPVRIIPATQDPRVPDQARPDRAGPQAAPRTVLAGPDGTAQDNAAAPDDLAPQYAPASHGSPASRYSTALPGDPAQPPGPAQPAGPGRTNGRTRRENPGQHKNPGQHEDTGLHGDADRRNATATRDGTAGGEESGRTRIAADAEPGVKVQARRSAPRLSGPNTLDPARNPRYLMYMLRQAGVFTGIYLLIETVLTLCFLLAAVAGTKLGPALRLEMDSLWLVALVLVIPFWLIPVPALLAEWSLIIEQGSGAAHTAFAHIHSAFQAHGTPVDSLRPRSVSRPAGGEHEYLELRRDHFSGYISCFAQGRDLYVGWSFWLHMSPLRLLLMVIGRNIQDVTSRGDGIHRSLRFESTRALVAAMHGATLAGIDAASSDLDPELTRETAINTHFRLG